MRVVTLNIRTGAAADGAFEWRKRREELIGLLREINGDVVCLQEVLAFQLDEIASGLNDYAFVGVGRDDGERLGECCPILFRGLELRSSGTVWLSETPSAPGSIAWGARLPRICTSAEFSRFTVANLHLDHESEQARTRGVGLVLTNFRSNIVCGDFNAAPSEACIQAMTEAGYEDSGIQSGGTFNNFQPEVPNAPRIDYVFLLPPLTGNAEVVREPLVSDHWPVIVDIAGVPSEARIRGG